MKESGFTINSQGKVVLMFECETCGWRTKDMKCGNKNCGKTEKLIWKK